MNGSRYQRGYAEKCVEWDCFLIPGIEALETILLIGLFEMLADSGQDSLPAEVDQSQA